MALEDALLKLAEAINNHAEALKVNAGYVPPEKTKAEPQVKKPTTDASTKESTITESAKTVETTDTPPVDEPVGDAPPDVDVAAMTADFLKLVNADRAKAEAVLTKLGFPKLKLVPANLHAKAFGLISEALKG